MSSGSGKTSVRKKRPLRLFIISFVISLGLTFLISESSFTVTQNYVLFLLFFALSLWVTEAVPPFAVGIFIIAYLVLTLGNKMLNPEPQNIEKYVATFSGSVIWLMLGGFFLAAAMTKTRLDEALFRFTLKISGNSSRNLLIGLMLTTMIASMLMSNTATTAMVIASIMPLLNSLGKSSPLSKALILGVPIAATTGGMGSIIGSPPNLIAVGALENAGINISFLDWMLFGLPVAIVLTGVCCFALIRLYLKEKQPIPLGFLDEGKKNLSVQEKTQKIIVIVIITVTIILWLTTSFTGLKVGAVSAIPLVFLTLTGVMKGKDVQALPWDTLLLVAGGLSLGLALLHSGLLDHYAGYFKKTDAHYLVLMICFAFVTMALANIMSHTATSTILIPLGMTILPGFESQIALIIAIAASTALFLPVSTPPNAIAYSTGFIEMKDFRPGALIVGIAGPILITLWVLLVGKI